MENETNYLEMRKEIPEGVMLLAVSKTKPYGMIESAYGDGARNFGENRVQEIERKFPPVAERPEGMKVHLIGQLQKNKVRKAVAISDMIESVDSMDLLLLIEKECARIERKLPVLLEFNSSGEEQKSGFRTEEELLAALEASKSFEYVSVVGLMTVGPLGFDREKNIDAFTKTKDLYEKGKEILPLTVLSMGMSADWQDAIACGSTEVRIGSAIFGGRA